MIVESPTTHSNLDGPISAKFHVRLVCSRVTISFPPLPVITSTLRKPPRGLRRELGKARIASISITCKAIQTGSHSPPQNRATGERRNAENDRSRCIERCRITIGKTETFAGTGKSSVASSCVFLSSVSPGPSKPSRQSSAAISEDGPTGEEAAKRAARLPRLGVPFPPIISSTIHRQPQRIRLRHQRRPRRPRQSHPRKIRAA